MIVYSCGTKVNIRLLNKSGFVTGICIRGQNITYAVGYDSGGKHQESWFTEPELVFSGNAVVEKIGFKTEEVQ